MDTEKAISPVPVQGPSNGGWKPLTRGYLLILTTVVWSATVGITWISSVPICYLARVAFTWVFYSFLNTGGNSLAISVIL